MPHPILTLKLRVPSLRRDIVPRPQLISRLDEVWQPDKRLILVCAPAGYGKTTLIASWISHWQQEIGAAPANPGLAWLTLDETDNNLRSFWLGLLEVLKQAMTAQRYQECRAAGEALDGSQSVSARDMAAVLLDALSELPGRLILVLDDFHCLTNSAVHACVQLLLANLPPAMRLLIATRADPPLALAQMRARNQMIEIRTAALQFTLAETTEFLSRTFDLALTAEQIALLANRTEGWAAGLQMAGLSLQGRADAAAFIQAFSGSQCFVLEYLIDEVLDRQPPEVQEFLVRTSIYDRLCTESCDYLLDQQRSGPITLASLERMNLFLVPLDEEGRWYRYHHLFASLLRGRLRQSLDPEAIGELYRRASQWYESKGLLAEAIAQALAAPDRTYAADLLEREILVFFYHSEITQVHRWLEMLPQPLIEQRALLCAVNAAAVALLAPYPPQSLPAAEKWMQAAEHALLIDTHGCDLARAFIYTIRSYWARFRGEPAETVIQLISNALALLPAQPDSALDRNQLRIRSALQTNLGYAYWAAGDEPAARQAFMQARHISNDGDDLFNESAAINMLVGISCLHGELGEAARLCQEALAFFDGQQAQLGHRVPYSGEIGVQLAEILIERNELAEAEQLLNENLELAKWTHSHAILIRGHLALARLAAGRGNPAAAFEHLDQAEKISSEGEGMAGAQRTLLWLAMSGLHPEYLDLARQWGRKYTLAEFRPGPPQLDWMISVALARQFLADEASLRSGQANPPTPERVDLLAWLQRQELAVQARGWAHWEIQLGVIECLTRRVDGDKAGALAALRRALELAAPGGYTRIFVEEGEPLRELLGELGDKAGWLAPYLHKLRMAFSERSGRPEHLPGSPEPLVEPLTVREREVLLLICQGLSNQAIAARLVVTLSTVKKHNYSIFGKLAVSSRAQAIVRAEQLGLSS